MVFTHKITTNPTNFPMIFKGTLILASEVHSYNTRLVLTHNSHWPRITNNYAVYLIFREYMAMLKNFYPQSRFLTPKPSHQLQASPSLQSRPVSPLLQARPASPLLQSRPASPLSQSFQEGATSSKSKKVTDGKCRSRIVWATKETQILLEVWGSKYAEIKSASTSQKRKIWEQISCEFVIACRRENISQIQQKFVEQLIKRVTNLEYEYRQIRTRMNSTEEGGAKKIMGTFKFFHAQDEVLGSRHGVNPALMTIESTAIIPSGASVDSMETADEADLSHEVESGIL